MEKILMVGSNGFIGRNLKEFLSNSNLSYDVYTPTGKELDVSDYMAVKETLEKQYYDVIIHAAVYNPRVGEGKDASKELDKNLRMFYNFERHKDKFGKMIYFGSGAEFDKSQNISFVSEEDLKNGIPRNDYGFYKYIINKQITNSDNIYNLRVFGLFGKYENWKSTFISGACCKALKGVPITIRQNVYFDYLYIEDFCKIVKWFIENNGKYRNYNIVSGSKVDLLTIANTVKEISNKDIPIYICKEGYANEYTANNNRMLNEIGGFTFTPMKEAISRLYKWYKEHEEDIDLYSLLY